MTLWVFDEDVQAGGLLELLRAAAGAPVSVDTETCDWEPGDPLIGPTAPRPVCATLAGEGWSAFVRLHQRPELARALAAGLTCIGEFVGANTSFDAHALSHESLGQAFGGFTPGEALAGVLWLDVLVLSRAENAVRRGHDLKSLGAEVLGRNPPSFKQMRVEVFGKALTKREVPYADGRPAAGTLDEERCLNHPFFRAYALHDARNTFDLRAPLLASLERQSPRALEAFRRLVQPQSREAWLGERRGVPVSLEALKVSGARAEADLAAVKARLDARCPGVLWTSPAQVKAALHGAGLPVESTDVGTLTHVRDVLLEGPDPRREFVADLLEFRAADKQLAAFFRRLPLGIHEGRVHPSVRVSGTTTGRDSCANPNAQQMSATKDKWHLRAAFQTAPSLAEQRAYVAEMNANVEAQMPGWRLSARHPLPASAPGKLLVVCDYSGIEWVLAAELSGDEAMLRAHALGWCPHSYTASQVFPGVRAWVAENGGPSLETLGECGVKKRFKRQRQAAKTTNYASLYGSGAYTLAAQLLQAGVRIPATDEQASAEWSARFEAWAAGNGPGPGEVEMSCEGLLAGWAATYWGFDRWRKALVANVRNAVLEGRPACERGVYTIGGRLRQVDERAMLWHSHPDREMRARYKAEGRSLVSAGVQGSAADLLHLAQLKVVRDVELARLGYRLLLPVHDELVGEVRARNARRATHRVKALMVGAAAELGIKARVGASGGWGRSWATAK